MKTQIFLPAELLEALRLIAAHEGFGRIATLLRADAESELALSEQEAKILARFAQYLQLRAEMRVMSGDNKIDPKNYDTETAGLPDKLLSYLLSDFPSCISNQR